MRKENVRKTINYLLLLWLSPQNKTGGCIGFGPSGKIENVECRICNKVYTRGKKGINLKIVLIVILLLFLVTLFF